MMRSGCTLVRIYVECRCTRYLVLSIEHESGKRKEKEKEKEKKEERETEHATKSYDHT